MPTPVLRESYSVTDAGGARIRVERLDDRASGDCPRCGERAAYPWSVTGLNGYIDACDECAPASALDALRNRREDE